MALEITKEDLQQLHANGVVSSYKRFEAWKRDFCENTQNLLHGKTLKIFWMQLIPLYTLTAGKDKHCYKNFVKFRRAAYYEKMEIEI